MNHVFIFLYITFQKHSFLYAFCNRSSGMPSKFFYMRDIGIKTFRRLYVQNFFSINYISNLSYTYKLTMAYIKDLVARSPTLINNSCNGFRRILNINKIITNARIVYFNRLTGFITPNQMLH